MGLDGNITNKARTILAQRRQAAQMTANLHMQEISETIPELLRLKAELAETGAQLVQVVLARPANLDDLVEKLRDHNLTIQQKMKTLLAEKGYPEDYLKVKYTCPDCEDTGYVGNQKCACMLRLIKRLSAESMNELSPLTLSDFEGFQLDYYPDNTVGAVNPRKQMGNVYQYCKRYAETFTMASPSLLLYGSTGLGKTHLSLAIARAVLEKGYSAVYGSAQDLFRQIEREHFGKDSADKDTLGRLLECDLLILDDLGAEFESSYYTSCLYNIVNSRISMQKPTIISSNLEPAQLQQRYPDRIVSRLLAVYRHLAFVGKDIRQLKVTEQK